MLSVTSPIENVSIKEYRKILNIIRESIENQTKETPFLSTNVLPKTDSNIGTFCLEVLKGLKEKRKKFRGVKNV